MRYYLIVLLLLCLSKTVLSQRHVILDSNFVKSVEYYGKSKKVKKEYFYDKEGKLHPEVLRYDKKGALKIRYHYYHGKQLLAYTYSTKGNDKGKLIKINGLKVDRTPSKHMYEIDSSTIQIPRVNYTDQNGLRQGKWYVRDIIKDVSGFSYKEFYFMGEYKDGLKQGKWKYYNYYGKQLRGVVEYRNDTIHGEVLFYDKKGNKTAYYQYENGVKNGIYEGYYDNGQLGTKAKFKDNDFIGEYTEYKKNGKVKKYIEDTTKEHPYK